MKKIKSITLSKIGSHFDGLVAYFPKARTLTAFLTDPLKKPDKSDTDYDSLLEQYNDASLIDKLCKLIHDLPSVKGLSKQCPAINNIDLFCIFDDEKPDTNGSYCSISDEIELNFSSDPDGAFCAEDLLISTIVHELRHGYQKHSGVFQFREDEALKSDRYENLVFNRVIEADSTVFSIVVAYELLLIKNDPRAINALLKSSRKVSAKAYMAAVKRAPESHWNGKAAEKAFCSYFQYANRGLLKTYDLSLVEKFFGVADNVFKSKLEMASKPECLEYIKPLSVMPYQQSTELYQRKNYLSPMPLDAQRLLEVLSKNVIESIEDNEDIIVVFNRSPRVIPRWAL